MFPECRQLHNDHRIAVEMRAWTPAHTHPIRDSALQDGARPKPEPRNIGGFLMIHIMQYPLRHQVAESDGRDDAVAGSDSQSGADSRDYSDMLYDEDTDEERDDPRATMLDFMVAVTFSGVVTLGALILGSINLLKYLHGG
jgi:hypothetical protein